MKYLVRNKDGEIELTVTLGGLEEIERWILSWGAHARVIEPIELKKLIHSAAQGILAGD